MTSSALRILRVPLTVVAVWVALVILVPAAMTQYAPYVVRPGIGCFAVGPRILVGGVPVCRSLADIYHLSAVDLLVDSMFRSLALLGGAAILALIVGTALGVAAALVRRHALPAGAILVTAALLTAVPAFFIAYFLQIAVIMLGPEGVGFRLLPVFGFGYDEHLVLPLLAISVPAVAYTAQLCATRLVDVLRADFITTAHAKGLHMGWILIVHVLPHIRPVLLEGLGSGLRVSVASLPIVEYLFQWRGIGQLGLEAVGVHDAQVLIFSAVLLAFFFAMLSALADLSRPRGLYRLA